MVFLACGKPNKSTSDDPSFDIDVVSSVLTVEAGNKATAVVRLKPKSGFSGTVDLSSEGFVSGVVGHDTSKELSGETATSNLQLSVDTSVAMGTYEGRVVAKSGAIKKTVPLTIQVLSGSAPTGGFVLSVSPAEVTLVAGGSARVDVTVERGPGFTQPILLSLVDAPEGVSAPTTTIESGSTAGKLVISAQASASLSTTTVKVQADAVSANRSLPLSIKVVSADSVFGLDLTFGVGGLMDLSQIPGFILTQTVVRPDGRIVLGGFNEETDPTESLLIQSTSSGTLDSTFADAGVSVGLEHAISGVVLMPDGRIIAAGTQNGLEAKLVRHAANGAVDLSFGQNGSAVQAPFQVGDESSLEVTAVRVLADDSIVIAGLETIVPSSAFVARFTANGTLMSNFGTGGVFRLPATEFGTVRLFRQPSGKLILVLEQQRASLDILAVRLTEDGVLDPSYGAQGTAVVGAATIKDMLVTAAMGPDGSLFVLSNLSPGDAELVKLTPDGMPDATFANASVFPVAGRVPMEVGVASDGRVYIVGDKKLPAGNCGSIFRLTSVGMVDAAWSLPPATGFEICEGTNDLSFTSISFAANGNIIVGGSRQTEGSESVTAFVTRLLP